MKSNKQRLYPRIYGATFRQGEGRIARGKSGPFLLTNIDHEFPLFLNRLDAHCPGSAFQKQAD